MNASNPYFASAVAMAPAVLGAAPDIRDIRGPISIPAVWPLVLLVVGAVLLALALAAAIYGIVRRVRRGRVKTAAEIALERLERARGLAQEGGAAELSGELSSAVRDYIQARFELRAPHLTTEEFLNDLRLAPESPVAAHRESLGDFLDTCDLAKFARFAIDVEHMRAMVDAAESFVRATAAPRPADPVRMRQQGALSEQEART